MPNSTYSAHFPEMQERVPSDSVHVNLEPNRREIEHFLASTVRDSIHICSISPDGSSRPTGKLFGDDITAATAWSVEQNRARRNVYWTVNIVCSTVRTKPTKSEVSAARFCHVDLDPPKDGTFFDVTSALKTLDDMRYQPSFVFNSGAGIQAFWRLDVMVKDIEAVEICNAGLATLLGGDKCHNIDRLMRIPGTVNFPDARKRARGRIPALASILRPDAGASSNFRELSADILAWTTRRDQPVGLRFPVQPITLESLAIARDDEIYLLVNSPDPSRRSEILLKSAGKLVRRGYTDDQITRLLLNRDYAVSRHCYDQSNPLRAVQRVITKARLDLTKSSSRGQRQIRKTDTRSPSAVDMSEDAIALAFTDTYKDSLRFDSEIGSWFHWDGTRWRQEKTNLALDYARQTARAQGGGEKTWGKASVAAGVEKFARADRAHAVKNEIWDVDPFLLGTPDGTVDLRTGKLRPAVREDNITRQTTVAPRFEQPILWLDFLNQAMDGDQDLIRFLQIWTGYCLTGDTREQSLVFAHGDGGNGKGVFLNAISTIFGDYAVAAAMDTFTSSKYERHPTEMAMLHGPRLVTANETEAGKAWAEARIKLISGGDPITARFMRQDNFTFVPQFKLLIAGNHAPTLQNVDHAIVRRFLILPFVTKPNTPDKELAAKLKKEHGQILAWAIQGCLDWQANGLPRPKAVEVATSAYLNSQDVAKQWFEERCIAHRDSCDTVAHFYADWCSFAKELGEDAGSAKTFGAMMGRHGYASQSARISGTVARIYRGIALRRNGVVGQIKPNPESA